MPELPASATSLRRSRRRRLLLGLGLATAGARAQSFPSRAIRILVPFGAGGVADLTARVVAEPLAQALGQPVLVDNRPGAGGVAAGEALVRSEPDGHTLLLISNGTAVSASLFKSLPFDAVRDFAPISTLATFDIGIVVAAQSRFRGLSDLLAFARANPGKLNLGSINVGSTQNLVAELFKHAGALDLQIVPFNGTPALLTALRGGEIDAAVEILGPVMGQIQARTMRVLALSSSRRSALLPDVPTAQEAGVVGLVASSWNGLAAPARTPPSVLARLNRELVTLLNAPDIRKKLHELNVEAAGSTPQQAADLLASDIRRWGEVITRAKIALQ